MKRVEREPERRVGLCCGCRGLADLPLFRVAQSIYRCADCRDLGPPWARDPQAQPDQAPANEDR